MNICHPQSTAMINLDKDHQRILPPGNNYWRKDPYKLQKYPSRPLNNYKGEDVPYNREILFIVTLTK